MTKKEIKEEAERLAEEERKKHAGQGEANTNTAGAVNRIKKAMISGGAALQAEIDRLGTLKDVIEGILPELAGLYVIFSAPGEGKSFIILDWLLCIATGIPYHGREVQKQSVIYCAAEGQVGVLIRIKSWLNYHGLTMADLDHFHLLPIGVVLDDIKTLWAAISVIKDLNIKNLGQIVFDTLARNMIGDENSTKDMGGIVIACGTLREQTGAQIGLIHHTGKDESKGARGAIALTGATDAMYKTKYDPKKHIFTLICERYKDGEKFPPMYFRAEIVPSGFFKKGKEILSLVPVLDDEIKAEVVQAKATGLKGANQIAYNALRQMLRQKGIEPPSHVANQIAADGVVLPTTRVVIEGDWRQHSYNVGISPNGKSQSAFKNAFDRACKHLLAEDHVRCFDNYFWIPEK